MVESTKAFYWSYHLFTWDKRNNFENVASDDWDVGTCSLITHETRPRHRHTSSVTSDNGSGMRTIVPVMWPSINMFYLVLINTHPVTRVTRILGMSNTTLASCQQHFLGSGPLRIMLSSSDMHQTTMTTFSRLLVMGRQGAQVWSERESWTKNFLWGDKPGWQRAGNCLPTFLAAASLPSFLCCPGWRHAFKDPDDIIFSCHHLEPVMSDRPCLPGDEVLQFVAWCPLAVSIVVSYTWS